MLPNPTKQSKVDTPLRTRKRASFLDQPACGTSNLQLAGEILTHNETTWTVRKRLRQLETLSGKVSVWANISLGAPSSLASAAANLSVNPPRNALQVGGTTYSQSSSTKPPNLEARKGPESHNLAYKCVASFGNLTNFLHLPLPDKLHSSRARLIPVRQ